MAKKVFAYGTTFFRLSVRFRNTKFTAKKEAFGIAKSCLHSRFR